MTEYKKGDRVKVAAFEGTVRHAPTYGLEVSAGESSVFIPHDADVTVEKVAPGWEWRDGDAIQAPSGGLSLNRRDGEWDSSYPGSDDRYADADVTLFVNDLGWRVLRYQAGEGDD